MRTRTHDKTYSPKAGKAATHGMSGHYLYYCWNSMIQRCYRPKTKQYKDYGGRGIAICPEWKKDVTAFFSWAIENGYEKGLSLERIDNDLGYAPGNCKFVNKFQQQRNRTNTKNVTINNVTKSIREWAAIYDIPYSVLYRRIVVKEIEPVNAVDLSFNLPRKNKVDKVIDIKEATKLIDRIKQSLDGRKQGWLAQKLNMDHVKLSNKMNLRVAFTDIEKKNISEILNVSL
jgi:hypothetical protein